MTINFSRRQLIGKLGLIFLASRIHPAIGSEIIQEAVMDWPKQPSNFLYVYSRQSLKKQFLLFLTNVFHLYPEDKLHQLIDVATSQLQADDKIYRQVQAQLPEIAVFLKDFRYSMPALKHQKQVMLQQTLDLLGDHKSFESYLEVGSTGRYLDVLEEGLLLGDTRYFIAEKPATYSPADIVDRGQIGKGGKYFDLNKYQPEAFQKIPKNSLDLVTVYIGFHHCPVPLRNDFISGIRNLMRPNGKLILRDHQVNSPDMYHMVALAHDVFNMGTIETLEYNEAELRNFYSLEQLDLLMQANGFSTDGRRLLQTGDPTQNTLMLYTKV